MGLTICVLLQAIFTWVVMAEISPAPNHSSTDYKVLPKGCPPLVDGPMLDFVKGVELTSLRGPYGCERVMECRVQTSPPNVDIMWYRNHELVESGAVRDITMGQQESTGSDSKPFLGVSEIVHRVCVDHLHSAHPPPAHPLFDEYQCKAQSSCDSESLTIEPIATTPISISRRNYRVGPGKSIKEFLTQWFRAPLITLATVTRMELAGHFAQMMCRASGNPAPSIRWSVLNEDDSLEFPIPGMGNKFPFVWTTKQGDILVDTSKTRLASLSFICRAVNSYGSDEQSSTLILLKEED